MSRWNHVLCWDCWARIEPERVAFRVLDAPSYPCCLCGTLTDSGIHRRANPTSYPCQGEHIWDADE